MWALCRILFFLLSFFKVKVHRFSILCLSICSVPNMLENDQSRTELKNKNRGENVKVPD